MVVCFCGVSRDRFKLFISLMVPVVSAIILRIPVHGDGRLKSVSLLRYMKKPSAEESKYAYHIADRR